MNKESILFFQMTRDFLTAYLPKQKGASENTVRAYKTGINQFLDFACRYLSVKLEDFHFGYVNRETVEKYLVTLEEEQGYSVSSRNQRLAVLKSFCKFSGLRNVTVLSIYQEISAIPVKKKADKPIEFFSEAALEGILNAADTTKRNGKRDRTFMILLYDTGARLQEVIGIRIKDLYIDPENVSGKTYVEVYGKGQKHRRIPLMEKTVLHLLEYLKAFHPDRKGDDHLFYVRHSGRVEPLSQDAVEKFIERYGRKAKEACPEVPDKVYPHMFRHSRAMHLYRNGMPLPLVSEWLGHAQLETTINYYANADTKMKKEAIDKATSKLNPILTAKVEKEIKYTEDTIRELYGLM